MVHAPGNHFARVLECIFLRNIRISLLEAGIVYKCNEGRRECMVMQIVQCLARMGDVAAVVGRQPRANGGDRRRILEILHGHERQIEHLAHPFLQHDRKQLQHRIGTGIRFVVTLDDTESVCKFAGLMHLRLGDAFEYLARQPIARQGAQRRLLGARKAAILQDPLFYDIHSPVAAFAFLDQLERGIAYCIVFVFKRLNAELVSFCRTR
jgi:hypothetical protein